jgi:hypothetical protein
MSSMSANPLLSRGICIVLMSDSMEQVGSVLCQVLGSLQRQRVDPSSIRRPAGGDGGPGGDMQAAWNRLRLRDRRYPIRLLLPDIPLTHWIHGSTATEATTVSPADVDRDT